jgi:molybdate-binding protein
MVAVDFDLHFTYVLAVWEGSAHDAIILIDALQRQNGVVVPKGNIL